MRRPKDGSREATEGPGERVVMKPMVAELSLRKQVLKDIVRGDSQAPNGVAVR
jgi:hypothetical protein